MAPQATRRVVLPESDPLQAQTAGRGEMARRRTVTARAYNEVADYALELGLENAFIQELDSHHRYLPDFDSDRPFE